MHLPVQWDLRFLSPPNFFSLSLLSDVFSPLPATIFSIDMSGDVGKHIHRIVSWLIDVQAYQMFDAIFFPCMMHYEIQRIF